MREWYYFGCDTGPGHYLFGEGMRSVRPSSDNRALSKMDRGIFDGTLAPMIKPIRLYEATYNVLPGMGFVALAWHDQSEDTRSGSNSVVFAPIIAGEPMPDFDAIVAGGKQRFPRVFTRLPKPLVPWEPAEATALRAHLQETAS